VREIRTLRVMWRELETELRSHLPVTAPVPDPTLGHQNLSGTQYYLHFTAELFPEITARADAAFGDVIPRRSQP
jgi:integrase/recombinase XerD